MSVIVKTTSGGNSGILFKKTDGSGYPTEVLVRSDTVAEDLFFSADTKLFFNLQKLEVIADTIGKRAFCNQFTNAQSLTIKIRAKNIGASAFTGLGDTSKKSGKVWISKDCESIADYAFYTSVYKICCEAETKPSGFAASWTDKTVTYGVTEAEFDAM